VPSCVLKPGRKTGKEIAQFCIMSGLARELIVNLFGTYGDSIDFDSFGGL